MPTILIADDEASIVELVRVTLEDERIQVVEALDGETALALAETHRPDLVLLDVNLPDMSGLEVCAQLRRDPRLASMKIVRSEERRVGKEHRRMRARKHS